MKNIVIVIVIVIFIVIVIVIVMPNFKVLFRVVIFLKKSCRPFDFEKNVENYTLS